MRQKQARGFDLFSKSGHLERFFCIRLKQVKVSVEDVPIPIFTNMSPRSFQMVKGDTS